MIVVLLSNLVGHAANKNVLFSVPAASLARFGQAGAATLKVDGTCFDSSKSIVISASGSGSLVISKMVAGTISLRQSG